MVKLGQTLEGTSEIGIKLGQELEGTTWELGIKVGPALEGMSEIGIKVGPELEGTLEIGILLGLAYTGVSERKADGIDTLATVQKMKNLSASDAFGVVTSSLVQDSNTWILDNLELG